MDDDPPVETLSGDPEADEEVVEAEEDEMFEDELEEDQVEVRHISVGYTLG